MRHLKITALAVVAAAGFLTFAGSASAAPVLTSPGGTEYTGHFATTLEKGSSVLFKLPYANMTCTESTMTASINVNNETHAAGSISTFDFSTCGPAAFDPLKNAEGTYGSLTLTGKGEIIGFNIRITMLAGNFHCVFGSASGGTKLGTLTGGTPATIDIAANLPLVEGSAFLCGSTAAFWTASYTVTTPGTLLIT